MTLWSLFLTFFYVGTFTIGGGLVAITLMQQELVGRGLLTSERFFNMVAISEATPGPVGINVATYVGFEFYGILGALVTTLGTVLPSLLAILVIARISGRFKKNPWVKGAFYGIKAGTTGMIAVAAWHVIAVSLLRLPTFIETGNFMALINWPAMVLFIGTLIFNLKTDWHPVGFIIAGGAFGVIFL